MNFSRNQNQEKEANAIPVVLASASPRRRQLLQMIGLQPVVEIPRVNEEILAGENIETHLERICMAKAFAVYHKRYFNHLLLAADTVVICEEKTLGKPSGRDEARQMLASLSGRRHDVFTGIATLYRGASAFAVSRTAVFFKKIQPREIDFYLDREEYLDKAGAYAVQGLASLFVERIEGCYFNVMGLPLNLFYRQIQDMGLVLFDRVERND